MSVAALQHQLATSSLGEVALRPYLTQLCQSIAASMISDRERIALTVDADEGSAKAEISVSLGLLVTELVINALKHAFMEGRGGHIQVAYRRRGADWTLSVRDDGVGMGSAALPAKSGLGTSIVQALAKQLGATIEVSDANPGTLVSLTRTTGSAASKNAESAPAV